MANIPIQFQPTIPNRRLRPRNRTQYVYSTTRIYVPVVIIDWVLQDTTGTQEITGVYNDGHTGVAVNWPLDISGYNVTATQVYGANPEDFMDLATITLGENPP